MKKIYQNSLLAIFAVLLTISAFAQSHDVRFSGISAEQYSVKNLAYSIRVQPRNVGPDAYPKDSTLTLGLRINGSIAGTPFSAPLPFNWTANSNLAPITLTAPASFMDTVTVTGDSIDVCAIIAPYNVTKDPVLANNSICFKAKYEKNPSITIGASDINLFNKGTKLDPAKVNVNKPEFDSVTVIVKNKGNGRVPLNTSISLKMKVGSKATDVLTGRNFKTNFTKDSTLLFTITSATQLAKIQFDKTKGKVNVCAEATISIDTKPSDDSFCNEYNLDFASNVNELEATKINVFTSNNQLTVRNATVGSNMIVTNISGQTVLNTIINSNNEVFNTELTEGIYFVTVENTTTKVIVK